MDDHSREGRNPIIRVRAYGGQGGRGNLRENREDPAPTVGIAGISMRDAAHHVATNARPLYARARPSAAVCVNHAAPYARTHLPRTPPYLRRTRVTPGPLHPRILPRNPRVQRRWYDDGTAMGGDGKGLARGRAGWQVRGMVAGGMDGLRTLRLLRGAGGGIFALRRPRPYSRRWRGGRCDACGIDHHLRPRRDQQERRRGGLRRGAPLRPSRNGRIGFKPPYSKREPRRKACRDSIFTGFFW